MKLPTREQADAIIASDMLLTAMVKIDFSDGDTRKLIEAKVTEYYVGLEPDEQAAALFLEAALKYIREV